MGVDLDVTATPQHIDNHKAYVQAWIQSIRDKPETLIRAIKDAQAAATYMDYKAGLITDKEYEQACGSVLEVKQKERDRERLFAQLTPPSPPATLEKKRRCPLCSFASVTKLS